MPLQNTFTLDVDFKKKSIINEPTVTQNDEVTFILNVYDDGREFDLSGVSTSTLVSERPDKQSVMTLGVVTGTNQITFALGSTEISKVGKVDAAIQLFDVDGRVTTLPFTYKVLKDPSSGYIPSTDEQTLIELVLGEGPAILDAAEQATINANNASTNANDKASLANTAASNANTKADLANTAATNANEKATLAEEKATLANSAATYATTQGDYAKSKGAEAESIIANGPVSSVNGQTGAVTGLATTEELQALTNENIMLACILRQDPSTGVWSILDDNAHVSVHVLSISQDDNGIRINYDQTFDKIKSFIVVPDDVLNKTGFVFGGDVGLSFANITISKPSPISGYISSSDTGFDILDNIGINNVSYSNGVLRIEHEKTLNTLSPVITTTHDYNSKFSLNPTEVDQNFTELKVKRYKEEKSAIFNVMSNAFSALEGSDSEYSLASWENGILTINTPPVDGWDINLTGKDNIFPTLFSISNNQVLIKFFDVVGNVQVTTLPDYYFFTITRKDSGPIPETLGIGDLKCYFQRESLSSGKKINPNTPMPPGNNIWVFGLFEKATV